MSVKRARNLRKNMTDTERRLWRLLRSRQLEGFKFRRQHPIGPFIVDFICLEKKLIVELDGSQHLTNQDYDQNRTLWLNDKGYIIVRFWDSEVLNNSAGIIIKLLECLNP